jgi:putative membrane protein
VIACDMGPMFGGMWPMSFAGLLAWAGLVAVAVWAVARLLPRRSHDAQAVLAERFARGEIDEQEFAQRCRLLDATR